MGSNLRLALLIDGDNMQPELLPQMLAKVSKYGEIITCRVYGDLKKPHIANWIETQLQYKQLELRHQPNYVKSKNATDMGLVIDAMTILYTNKEINGFCIASDDSDFAPLAEHIFRQGLFIMGIGSKQASDALKKACDNNFVHIGNPQNKAEAKVFPPSASSGDSATMPKSLKKLLRKTLHSAGEGDGWASYSEIGQSLTDDPEFKTLATGPKKISKIVRAYRNDFDMEERESKTGSIVTYIRLKSNSKTTK